jgi:hypothetical protein
MVVGALITLSSSAQNQYLLDVFSILCLLPDQLGLAL